MEQSLGYIAQGESRRCAFCKELFMSSNKVSILGLLSSETFISHLAYRHVLGIP